jgi:iron(III) transport system ATP-binding protein
VQTLYELALFDSRIEIMDIGSAARYPVGSDVLVALPPETCWAYAVG